MSDEDRRKWDARYREGAYAERRHPSALLVEWLGRLPRGRALDIACGSGRNALHLAAAGYSVDAVDISTVALERARAAAEELGLTVRWQALDLEKDTLPQAQYELVVWMRYVNMPLMRQVASRLAANGCLVCEQHLACEQPVTGPTQPRFRLQAGELLKAAEGLHPRCYREGIVDDPDGRRAALAQLVACRGR